MAAFSDPSFDFKGYLENRPRYPDFLYETVLSFHQGRRDTVLDVGCGPGLSLFPFAYHFKNLIGVDPSEGMISEAQGAWRAWKGIQDASRTLIAKDASFEISSAENLSNIKAGSIDLITAATVSGIVQQCSRSLKELMMQMTLNRLLIGLIILHYGQN